MGTRKNIPRKKARAAKRIRTRIRLLPLLVICIIWRPVGGNELALPRSGGAQTSADLFPSEADFFTPGSSRYASQTPPKLTRKPQVSQPSTHWVTLNYSDPLLALNDLPNRSIADASDDAPIRGTGTTNDALFPKTHGEGLHGGTLLGVVYDAKTGDPLSGVGILISEAGQQSLSNDIGEFVIQGLEARPYKVTFVQQGYQITSVQIAIGPGLPTRHKQPLEPKALDADVFEMEALDVIEDFEEENATADRQFALREMSSLASSIGAAEFSNQGLGDAGSAVSKVAGANIVDGKYAVIRGLGDRYSATTLNGAIIPSSDPSRKAVQLDLFPTDLLEALVISKTFTPDMSGEFAGGSVDIQTLKFPEKPFVNFGYSQGWNSATGNLIAGSADRRIDFFGRTNDGIPDSAKPLPFPPGVNRPERDGSISEDQQLAADTWNELHQSSSFLPAFRQADPNTGVKLILGTAEETPFGKAGLVFGFTHDHEFSLRENVEINRGDAGSGEFRTSQGQIRNTYEESIDWGILVNGAIELNEWNTISATYITNTSATDAVTQGRRAFSIEAGTAGINDPVLGLPGTLDPDRLFFGKNARLFSAFDEVSYLERKSSTVQFNGTHRLNRGNGPGLDWLISESTAKENRPDQRTLRSFELAFDDPSLSIHPDVDQANVDPSLGSLLTLGNPLGNNATNSFRETLSTVETGQHVKADITIPIIGPPRVRIDDEMVESTEEPNILEMKTGASRFDRQRQVRGRLFRYELSPTLRNQSSTDDQAGVDNRNGFDELSADGIRSTGRTTGDFIISDQTLAGNNVRNVDASSLVESYYLMGLLKWDRLEFTGGVRREKETRNFLILPGLNPSAVVEASNPIPIENEYWLPAANLTHYFGEKDEFSKRGQQSIRFAYGKTVARPTFYEFAPIRTVDQKTGLSIVGNGELVDTLIDNYDFRWEYIPSPGAGRLRAPHRTHRACRREGRSAFVGQCG